MNQKEQLEKIEKVLNTLPNNEVVRIHNNYCYKIGDYNSIIYFMNELDDIVTAETPTEIIRTYGNIVL